MKVRLRGEALEMALIRSNKSQNWLAEKLGVRQGTISNYIRKKSSVSSRVRERMLSVFTDFSFDDLFIIEKPEHISAKETKPGNGKDATYQKPTDPGLDVYEPYY
jgi:transcriptional regulator with XRE-family HTH domain